MILWKQVEIDDHNNKIGKGEIFFEKTDEKRTFGKERKTMDRRSYEPVPFRNNDAGYGKGIVKRVFFDGKWWYHSRDHLSGPESIKTGKHMEYRWQSGIFRKI